MITFASDNNAGIHPQILKAIVSANSGQYVAYGNDAHTEKALEMFKRHFGSQSHAYFVFNGTAANVLSFQSTLKTYEAVICSDVAHIQTDECGAPERIAGVKLLPIPHSNGKISVESIKGKLVGRGEQRHVQPRMISITQATEMGTVYSSDEILKISRLCRSNELLLHMDGARLANAAAALGLTLKQATADLGVDILSFGATKNGAMGAEAVVIINPKLARDFGYIRKQSMQLASKMRFVSAQFVALLDGDLWLRNARKANKMARLLVREVSRLPQVTVAFEPEVNAVFAVLPKKAALRVQKKFFFYFIKENCGQGQSLVRWMTSFSTTRENVKAFVQSVARALE